MTNFSTKYSGYTVLGTADVAMAEVETLQLRLGSKVPFHIAGDELVFDDPTKKARRDSCAPFASSAQTQSVPLYNVVWAEVDESNVRVSVARPHGDNVKLETWVAAFTTPQPERQALTADAEATDKFVTALLAQAYREKPQPRRAYVLANPNSGPGAAVRKWESEVRPILEAAQVEVDVVILERGGQAAELVEAAELDKYDLIISLSGDGTPHEIFNGLAKRPDASRALQSVAVAHVPCGSGNAMAYSLYGTASASQAALDIVKGKVIPLDLMSVTQGSNRYVSFLTQTLGIVADSDLGTEHWRWMGDTRFDLGIGLRALQRKCYPCDLALKVEVEGKEAIVAHYRSHVHADAGHAGHDFGQSYKSEGLPPLRFGTVRDELPEGWELVRHNNVGCIYVGNMAWITKKDRFFRAALPSDGMMDFVMTRGDTSALTIIKTLTDVARSETLDLDTVSYKKISGYRLIPREQEDGFISIDGEKVPFEPFQVEVHRGLARVVAKQATYMYNGPPGMG